MVETIAMTECLHLCPEPSEQWYDGVDQIVAAVRITMPTSDGHDSDQHGGDDCHDGTRCLPRPASSGMMASIKTVMGI